MKKMFLVAVIFLVAIDGRAGDSVVSLRTLWLGDGEIPDSWIFVEGASTLKQLEWPVTQPSQALPVIHDGRLKLFGSPNVPDGEKNPEPQHSVDFPPSAKEVLLVGMSEADKNTFVAFEDVFREAKYNDWLVVNVSEEAIELTVGEMDAPMRLEAGTSAIFQPTMEKGKGGKVNARFMYRGAMRTFLSTYWPAVDGQRSLVIIYQDGKRVRARRIGERLHQGP
jgi:hypothetical protein